MATVGEPSHAKERAAQLGSGTGEQDREIENAAQASLAGAKVFEVQLQPTF
jgi:hypothetical protein